MGMGQIKNKEQDTPIKICITCKQNKHFNYKYTSYTQEGRGKYAHVKETHGRYKKDPKQTCKDKTYTGQKQQIANCRRKDK